MNGFYFQHLLIPFYDQAFCEPLKLNCKLKVNLVGLIHLVSMFTCCASMYGLLDCVGVTGSVYRCKVNAPQG